MNMVSLKIPLRVITLSNRSGWRKKKLPRMVAAHAAAGGQQKVLLVLVLVDPGDHFLGDVAVIIFVAAGAVRGVSAGMGPRLAVNAVHGEELEEPFIDEPARGLDHAVVFVIKKAAVHGWENQHGLAAVAVNFQLHILVEAAAPILVVFNVHGLPFVMRRCPRDSVVFTAFQGGTPRFEQSLPVRGARHVAVIAQGRGKHPAHRFMVDNLARKGGQGFGVGVAVRFVRAPADIGAVIGARDRRLEGVVDHHVGIFAVNIDVVGIVEHVGGQAAGRAHVDFQHGQAAIRFAEEFKMEKALPQAVGRCQFAPGIARSAGISRWV